MQKHELEMTTEGKNNILMIQFKALSVKLIKIGNYLLLMTVLLITVKIL